MSFRTFVALSACCAGLSFANLADAQQAQAQPKPAQPQRPAQPGQVKAGQVQAGQAGQQAQWQNADQTLATCIAIANQEEVAIAKLGEEKAKSKDVKEFAKTLVSDHKAFLQKLQRLAPEATQEGYLNEREATNANGQQTTSNERRDSAAPARVQQAGGQAKVNGTVQQTAATANEQQNAGAEAGQPINFVQLHREIAEECIRCAKRGMDKKSGAEFDECFVGHQIAAHEMMKTKLTVFQRHTSGELNQIIADGIETTEKHKKRAEELMSQLKDSDSSSAKRDSKSDKK